MEKDVIIKEANEYLTNGKTLRETAKILGIDIRTLQLHLKKLKTIDGDLWLLVENKKTTSQQIGRVKGGSIGVATSKYSLEEILVIARTIIKDELTYAEAAKVFDIPKSTIYELVHSSRVPQDIKDALDAVGYANHRGMLVADLGKKNGK